MAEYVLVSDLMGSITAAGALTLGLFIGLVVAVISRLAGLKRPLSGKRIRSLHIEMAGPKQNANAFDVGERSEVRTAQAEKFGSLVIRQWYLDEVVADESLGIN
jgi:hypothetical protein